MDVVSFGLKRKSTIQLENPATACHLVPMAWVWPMAVTRDVPRLGHPTVLPCPTPTLCNEDPHLLEEVTYLEELGITPLSKQSVGSLYEHLLGAVKRKADVQNGQHARVTTFQV